MPVNKKTSSKIKTRTNVGRSSLAKSSKSTLFTKRNGLIVATLAAVAGVAAVAFSFASTAPPYQYSYNEVCVPKATTNSSTTTQTDTQKQSDQQTCYNDSAQGMVYRLYAGLLGRPTPDSSGYQYLTQQFAGERVRPTQSLLVLNGVKAPADDKAFVVALFKNGLMRSEASIAKDSKGVDYWVKKLSGQDKWSRARVAITILNSREAKRANAARMNAYLATAPAVKVTQTAAAEQKKRYDAMVAYAKAQKTNADAAGKNALNAQNALNAAKASAGGAPSRERLTAIASNQRAAEGEYNKAVQKARATEKTKNAAARLRAKAADLAKYAPDIKEAAIKVGGKGDYSLAKIDANYALVKAYDKNAKEAAKNARQRISDIAAQYKIAEGNYEADQQRIAAAQRDATARARAQEQAAAAVVAGATAGVAIAKTGAERAEALAKLEAAKKQQEAAARAIAAAAAAAATRPHSSTPTTTIRNPIPIPVHARVCQKVPTTPKRHMVKVKLSPFGPTISQSVPYIPPRWNYRQVCVRT